MVFKTIVASIIAALLAGGVVYFGMPGEPLGNGSVSLRTSSQTAPQTPPEDTDAQTSQAQTETPNTKTQREERLIDKYVTGPLRKIIRPDPNAQPQRRTQPLSRNRKSVAQIAESANTETAEAQPETPTEAPSRTERTQSTERADAPRYYVLENGELREIEVLPGPTTEDAVNPDASYRILTVTEQAKQIDASELRDRAFLDIVDYAVSEQLYTAGVSAMEEINQVELRDTARSRIAIAYARSGDSRAAFGLIDDVEVDELRDVLRLQVIEAMILPERLPEGLQ